MRRPEMKNLERLRHWQGEKLKRADFADQAAYDRRRAAWHNRSLHETFGVVTGLEVVLVSGSAAVDPGLGYDAQGNPVWLARATQVFLPPDAADRVYYLVLADTGLAWIQEGEWFCTDGLPLAATTATGGLEPCRPQRIRALQRPRIYLGETVRGRTPWEIWEISAPGQTTKIQAGVETRIDTSAFGFTFTPHYFASLEAPLWSTSGGQRPDFAPTYLAHVANSTPEGFTFRLLLKDIALRSFGVAQAVARVRSVSKASFESLNVELEAPAIFAKGDAVALVRPRGTSASMIRGSDEELLQLDGTLGLAAGDRVALGNLPRTSRVLGFQSTQHTTIELAPGVSIASGAVVAYLAQDGSAGVARVISATASEAVLDRVWVPPESAHELRASAPGAKTVRLTAAPSSDGVKLQVSSVRIASGDWVVALPPTGTQLSNPVRVSSVHDTEVVLDQRIDRLDKNHRLLSLSQVFTIKGLRTDAGTGVAQVEVSGVFAPGDLVAVTEQPSSLAVVIDVEDNQVTLETGTGFQLTAGQHLVASNWEAAATVESAIPSSAGGFFLGVADSRFFRTGDLLLKWQNSGAATGPAQPQLDAMSAVTGIISSFLLVPTSHTSFARGEVILAARFPFVTALVATDAGNRLRVAAAGLQAGDWIAPLDAPGPFRITQLKQQLAADSFVTSEALDGLPVGTRLGVVHFAGVATVAASQTGDPANSIRLDAPLNARAAGDFLSPLTHFFDNAPYAIVEQVSGTSLLLSSGGNNRFAGTGIVPDGLIDGGVLAFASLTLTQPRIRLQAGETMAINDEVTAAGPGPLENDQSVAMFVTNVDASANRVTLAPRVGVPDYSFRPERVTLLSAFNERFIEEFALFAQRQGLYVTWTACQDFARSAIATSDPVASPCDTTSQEDPCRSQA